MLFGTLYENLLFLQGGNMSDPAATVGSISAVDAASTLSQGANGQVLITGTPSANSSVSAGISGESTISVEVTSIGSITLQFEKSIDGGTTWTIANMFIKGGPSNLVTTTTTNGVWETNAAAISNFRVRCIAYTSGTPSIRIQPSFGTGPIPVMIMPGSALQAGQVGRGINLSQLAREGRFPYTMGGTSAGFSGFVPPTVTPGASILTTSNIGAVPMGRAFVVTGAEVGATGMCQAFLNDAGSTMTLSSGQQAEYTGDAYSLVSIIGPNGGTARFGPWNGGLVFPEYHKLQAGVVNPTSSGVIFSAHADITDITMDFFYDALYSVVVLGDSIGWTMPGTQGVTASTSTPQASGCDLYGKRIVERLRQKGASVRLINKSFGSAQTASAYIRSLVGWIDVPMDLLIIELGMNDAAANAGIGFYQSNIQNIIQKAQNVNPNVTIIVCGPSSTDDPNRQYANIVAASSVGTAATSSTVTLPSSAGVSAGNLVWVVATGSGSGQYATLGTNISGNQWNITGGWPSGTPTGTLTISVWDQTTSPLYVNHARTLAQAAVNASTGHVYYCDLSTAYSNTGTDLTTYFGDVAPSVHPNQAGHLLLANVLATVIQNTDFYINKLGLTGSF